jgi:nucleoside phosphorylase
VDFALLTALEEEQAALLTHLSGARALDKAEGDVATVYAAEIRTTRADGTVYRVVLGCIGAMGPAPAATRAAEIADRFQPRRVLLVGIAGGVSGEAELGDVLVADQIADYTLGKDSGQERAVRWQVFRADPGLLDSARQLSTGWQGSIRVPRPSVGESARRIGVVASGGDVIAAAARVAELRAAWPKLVGVEMEGGGVATALAEVKERPPFLMIRGVSDLADEAKSAAATRAYRAYACDAAAAYAIALLQRGPYPAIERGRESPRSGEDLAARQKRIHLRLQQAFSLQELEIFIRSAFPEILGGLSEIVSPVHDLRYQTFRVVDYCYRHRKLSRLDAELDKALGPPGEGEA